MYIERETDWQSYGSEKERKRKLGGDQTLDQIDKRRVGTLHFRPVGGDQTHQGLTMAVCDVGIAGLAMMFHVAPPPPPRPPSLDLQLVLRGDSGGGSTTREMLCQSRGWWTQFPAFFFGV